MAPPAERACTGYGPFVEPFVDWVGSLRGTRWGKHSHTFAHAIDRSFFASKCFETASAHTRLLAYTSNVAPSRARSPLTRHLSSSRPNVNAHGKECIVRARGSPLRLLRVEGVLREEKARDAPCASLYLSQSPGQHLLVYLSQAVVADSPCENESPLFSPSVAEKA